MNEECKPILTDKEFEELVNGTMERVYLLKLCVEQGAETREEMAAIARANVMSEYAKDPKVWNALCAWNNMWHENEPYK